MTVLCDGIGMILFSSLWQLEQFQVIKPVSLSKPELERNKAALFFDKKKAEDRLANKTHKAETSGKQSSKVVRQ